jgi:hypothetical protein
MISQARAQRIEHWPLDRLVPYARNSRTHSDAQVAQIAASIAEFGFNNPILVDTQAGIIAGWGRLLAARKLNLTEVPVIVLDHLSEAQKRAYIFLRISYHAIPAVAHNLPNLPALGRDDLSVVIRPSCRPPANFAAEAPSVALAKGYVVEYQHDTLAGALFRTQAFGVSVARSSSATRASMSSNSMALAA